MDLLPLTGLGAPDVALTLNRVALGAFFTISGYHKLFNSTRHATFVQTLEACKVPMIKINQWFVPSVEFSGGLALLVGLLAPLAALGLIIICTVATCTDGIKRIPNWKPLDKADYVDCVLYLPEVLYIVMLLMVFLCGAGTISLDYMVLHTLG